MRWESSDGSCSACSRGSSRRRSSRARDFGLILTTLLGIGGALLGGFLASLVGLGDPVDTFFDLSTWVAAVVGALVILWVGSKVGIGRGRRSRLRPSG